MAASVIYNPEYARARFDAMVRTQYAVDGRRGKFRVGRKRRAIRALVGAAIAAATLTLPAPTASAAPVTEDSASWDCRTMGNQVCGPTNDQGVVAGQYADGLLVPWSATEVPAWCLDVCRGA